MIAAGREQSAGDKPVLDMAGCLVLAKLAAQGEKTDAAVEFYRAALKQARDQQAFVIYSELGEYLLRLDKYDEAAGVYEEAAASPSMRPARWRFLLGLSHAREMGGKTAEAVAAVVEAKKLRPDDAALHYQEAWIYYHAKQWDQAVSHFEQMIASFPDDKDHVRRARLSLSNIHVERGDRQKGEEILEKVLAEDPDDPAVNNDLGYLYAERGKNLEKAESMIRKAIAAEPENPAYLDSMGWVLFKLGKIEEALPYLEQAVTKPSGDDPTILDHLGDCYDRLGKTEKAVDAWQRALKRALKETPPKVETVERLRAKIEKFKPASKEAATETPQAAKPEKETADKDR
jgi:tetratricopeptide (TPR) repeat protein